jgi:hypothetical protein
MLNLSELGENVAHIKFGIGFRNAKKKKPQLVLTHPIYSVGVEKNYYEMESVMRRLRASPVFENNLRGCFLMLFLS